MLKKLTSFALALLMMFSVMYGIDIKAYAYDAGTIELGETKNVEITIESDVAEFTFTPSRDMKVRFYSHDSGSADPSAYIYKDGLQVAYNDDDANGLDFLIECELEAETEYTLEAATYKGTATYKVTLEEIVETSLNGVTYILEADSAIISAYEGNDSTLSIPETISYGGKSYTVTEIRDRVFQENVEIKSISLPDTVNKLGNFVFYGCSALETVNIPNDLTEISISAFANCSSLKNIVIGDNVKRIGQSAFWGCTSIKSIVIPDSVVSIGEYAFCGCTALENVKISKNITVISACMFENCTSLKSITIPDNIALIREKAFKGCTNLSRVNLPSNLKQIGAGAFKNTAYYNEPANWTDNLLICEGVALALKEGSTGALKIPEGVRALEESLCIDNTEITSVTFPTTLKEIPEFAFSGCTGITSVNIPSNVETIHNGAFKNCTGIESLTISNGVKTIDGEAFRYCSKIDSVTLPKSIKSISAIAFAGTGFFTNENNWEDGVLYLGDILLATKDDIVKGDTNGEYIIKDGVVLIADKAFSYNESIKKVILSKSVKTIGSSAFESASNLEEIVLNKGLEKIGDLAFYTTSLADISIPDTVKEIGTDVFYDTPFYSNEKNWTGDNLYVDNCLIANKYAGKKIDNLVIQNGTRVIADSCFISDFHLFDEINNVVIPGSVTRIPIYAFGGTTVKNITIPYSVKEIGMGAFYGSSPANIKYEGTLNDWKAIKRSAMNDSLSEAKVSTNECYHGHTYKNVVTKATTSRNGKIVPTCTRCKATKNVTTINKIGKVKLSKTSYTYNGKVKKPTVIVKDSQGRTISSKYYTVSYAKGRKNVGKYSVKVTFKGNYSGTRTMSFKIIPKGTSVSKVTAGKKKFTVKWKKQNKQTTGYQIQYATNKRFKKAKTTTVKSNKTTKKTISKLKAKKKYYVRIRTYKIVKGKKYYSSWSKAKTVKTKR